MPGEPWGAFTGPVCVCVYPFSVREWSTFFGDHKGSILSNKTEIGQKARKEIADFISTGKDDRARIRVEHIIREDYLVEAMELLEMYCDLILARFGLIQTQK